MCDESVGETNSDAIGCEQADRNKKDLGESIDHGQSNEAKRVPGEAGDDPICPDQTAEAKKILCETNGDSMSGGGQPATLLHYEIDTKYGRLVFDYDPSFEVADGGDNKIGAVIKAFEDRFGDDLVSVAQLESRINLEQGKGITELERPQHLRQLYVNQHTSAAWAEFTNGLGRWLNNALGQFFELSILAARIQNRVFNDDGAATLKDGAYLISSLVKAQVEQWLKFPHISGKPLMNLPFHYYVDCLPAWRDAKIIYSQNKQRPAWRKMIEAVHPKLPRDLVEWLGFKETLGAEAFPELPIAASKRLSKKLAEGYSLRNASEIALEHAARLCGYPEYEYSVSHLKTSKADHFELAVSMGLKSYLKNAGLPPPKENAKEKNPK